MEQNQKIWNRRFILLFLTNLLVLAAFYASIPIIPIYRQEIGITGSRVGIVLTAMSVATILFRPVAGYLLDNFNRYRVYLLFLALFCLSFPAFIAFPLFGALIVIRLYMGAVYSVCCSATMTLAGDVLPPTKITEGISRFAFTVSIGMAVGPYVGLQVQSHMSSKASFLTIFGITVLAFICVSCCRIKYPKVQRKKFSLRDSIYGSALFLHLPRGGDAGFQAVHTEDDRCRSSSGTRLSQPGNSDSDNDQLSVPVYRRTSAGRRLLFRVGVRNSAAVVPVLCHRHHSRTQAGCGQRHLYALL